jgi:potassium-transporting ATPase KdpC subunit
VINMNSIRKEARIGVTLLAAVCLLSLVYTSVIWGIAQITEPDKANGSLISVDGVIVGSELIGQSFASPGYFHGRPSAVDYAGDASGGSNLAPTSAKLMEDVSKRIEQVRKENNLAPDAPVPADLVLSSASGLDPDVSVASAMLQASRVASERGVPDSQVKSLVESYIQPVQFGILGQERVNVLKLNLGLDQMTRSTK